MEIDDVQACMTDALVSQYFLHFFLAFLGSDLISRVSTSGIQFLIFFRSRPTCAYSFVWYLKEKFFDLSHERLRFDEPLLLGESCAGLSFSAFSCLAFVFRDVVSFTYFVQIAILRWKNGKINSSNGTKRFLISPLD